MWETTPTMRLDQGALLGSCPHPPPSLPPPQVESNFASYHKFLMQALVYLSSPHRHLKMTAMKFIGRWWPRGLALPPPHCPLPERLHWTASASALGSAPAGAVGWAQAGHHWSQQPGSGLLPLITFLLCRRDTARLLQQPLLLLKDGRRENPQET